MHVVVVYYIVQYTDGIDKFPAMKKVQLITWLWRSLFGGKYGGFNEGKMLIVTHLTLK